MDKYIVIDGKMRKDEKEYIRSLKADVIELTQNNGVYDEISSHVDIFCSKINGKVIFEKRLYSLLKSKSQIFKENIISGDSFIKGNYPNDIAYNVCNIGNNAIHNFKYTDKTILNVIQKEKLNMININQGYSNCSIAVIDDSSAIVADKKIGEVLLKNGIDVLLLDKEDLDIKLLKNNGKYSTMKGFIGGCIARIEDKIIVFGDINKIDKYGKIRDFVNARKLELVYFKDLDVIDYGGVVTF